MRRIIIIENSGKVNFGGGQKITLQVAEILSKTCELVFVDFAKGTRFEQMINEKFPDSSKVLLKGRSFFFPFKYLNWLLDLVVLTCLFPGNLRKIKYYVTKKTLIYVTTKKGLLYAYMMKVMYGVPFIYHAHLVENTKSIFYFLYRSCLKKAEMSLCVSKAVYDTIKLPNKILLYNPNINDKGFKGRKNKDKFVVAAMGSLIKIKGFEYYIKAADKVSEKLPVEFRLYGEGPLHDTLETLSNGKVKFMGFSENIMNELDSPEPPDPITKTDLYLAGLSGGADSAARRRTLQQELGLPEHLGSAGLLQALNLLMTREEFQHRYGELR